MKTFLFAAAVFCGTPVLVYAQLPVPPDLEPGDKYHLVFITTEVRTATSTEIGSYDTFVQAAANEAGIGAGVNWRAVASTATVHARDHAVIGADTPVYNMNLQKVATGFNDFWDGSHSANINRDPLGGLLNFDVWTGTQLNGLKADGLTLGGATAWCGYSGNGGAEWLNNLQVETSLMLSMYGLSEELSVPGGEGVTINAGLNGNWWNGLARSGEGAQIEVSATNSGGLVVVVTFYSYGPAGGQIFLIGVGNPNGDMVDVDVFITDGAVWGDDFDPNDVVETQWGTGKFVAKSCDLIEMTLMPNLAYQTAGYTDLEYELVRLTTPVIPCPFED